MSTVESTYADDDDNYYEVTLPPDNRRARRVTGGLIVLIIIGVSFYGGVWMQKNHGKTSASTGSTRNFAAPAGFNRNGAPAGTNGTVTSVDGSFIYVTEASGNVVKIATSGSSAITKTEKGTVADIKPGETVRVNGQAGDDGTVSATSISVSN